MGRDVGENGGPVEEAVMSAACCQLCPDRHTVSDEGMDVVPLFLIYQRTESDLLGERIADGEFVCAFGESSDIVGGDRLVGPDAA